MSGFEIAGVVLGAFPLLLDGAKELQGLAKKFEFYWEFRTMFESFIDDVVGQRISYDLNIALLLDALDVSEEDRKRLYDGTEPGLWHERHIEAEIRRKVKEEHFRWLICRFQNVGAALDELRQLLAVDKVSNDLLGARCAVWTYSLKFFMQTNLPNQSRARRIESKTYRLATSFSSRKDELLTKLKKNNDDIRRYLDGAMDLNFTFDSASRPSPGNGTHWKNYEKVQNQAEELFWTLQEHWPDNCVCSSGHPCGITAQRRQNSEGEGESIALMFNPLGYDQGLHVRVRVSQDGPQEMGKMRSERDDAVDKLDELSQRLSASHALKKSKQKWNFAKWFSPELLSSAPPKEASTNAQPNQRKAQHIDASEQENTSLPIQNLCESIAFAPAKPYIGFLKSKNNQHIYFHSAPWRQAEEPIEVESLDSVIRTQIYRANRLRIGLSTVLLLACVGSSPWLPTSWSPGELMFLRDPGTSALQPYLVHQSLLDSLRRFKVDSIREQERSKLHILGIILLELLYRQKLESHPSHPKMSMDSTSTELTNFCTAMEWHQEVEPDFGKPLADAIIWCLLCFRNPGKGIGSTDCLKDMWQHVVLPLEKLLSTW